MKSPASLEKPGFFANLPALTHLAAHPPSNCLVPGPVAPLRRSLTSHIEREDEPRQRPLDFRLIARLVQHTRPYARLRNGLLVTVLLRSFQLPGLTWVVAAVIN